MRHYLIELSNEVVVLHMKGRLEGNLNLPTYVTEAMGRCGVTKAAIKPQERLKYRANRRERGVRCVQETKIAKPPNAVGNAVPLCAIVIARSQCTAAHSEKKEDVYC